MTPRRLEPQEGPQYTFLASDADIAIFGGSAGGGKTHALLMDSTRGLTYPGYSCVLFRRTSPQIRLPGGLWDRSQEVYSLLGGSPRETFLNWTFPPPKYHNNQIQFSHLENEADKNNWYGAEVCFLGFDELVTFTESQFWFLVSRNRSLCGVKPYIRATTNPDPDSWVAGLISWWIDEETGYAIPERSGVVRWLIRVKDALYWFDHRAEAREFAIQTSGDSEHPPEPKSLTFILSTIFDNQVLMEKDPAYLSNLQSLPYVERMRLLGEGRKGGNWKVRPTAGLVFSREQFTIIDAMPARVKRRVRYIDKAGTEGGGKWTALVLMAEVEDFRFPFVVEDVVRGQWAAHNREKTIKQTADTDPEGTRIYLEQEPGSGGKESAENSVRSLAGHAVYADRVTGAKSVRVEPYSAQVQAGNVAILRAPWNKQFLDEHHNFDPQKADKGEIVCDVVDASAGAFNKLTGRGKKMFEAEGRAARQEQEQLPQAVIPQRPVPPGVTVEKINDVYETITVAQPSQAEYEKVAQQGPMVRDLWRR